MLGVVGGSLALLALVWMGAHAVFEVVASLHLVLTVLGAGYVGCLGVMLLWQASGESCAEQRVGLPTTVLGLAGLQFLNPKAWVLITTATAASPVGPHGLAMLALMVTVISSFCLILWALAGSAIARCLTDDRSRRWFDGAMGLALIGSAVALLLDI